MRIFTVEETTSTNDLALQYLQTNTQLPFAVIADQQSAGLGQQNKHWESPAGNLYVSLVLQPPTCKLPPSLLCATILCDWLTKQGFTPTCKWANDILLCGEKLAGILCQGATQKDKWQYLVIGIGLNVNVAPIPHSICLHTVDAKKRNPQALGKALFAYFVEAFSQPLPTVADYERYTSQGAELWQDAQDNCFLRLVDYQRGALHLQPLHKEGKEIITTSTQDYRYAYQKPVHLPLIVTDVGNSQTKITHFSATNNATVFSASNTEELHTALAKARALLKHTQRWVLYCISVNPDKSVQLQQSAAEYDFVVSLLATGCYRYRGDYPLTQLGKDRLAMLEAYLAYYPRGKKALIACFGTATTVDLLSAAGKHEGGLILAGLATSLHALHAHTHLPLAKLKGKAKKWGGDTSSAISNGILQSQLALLEKLQRQNSVEHTVVSGGFGAQIADCLPSAEYDPLLVAKGIRAMVWRH